mmetsp:Transcript_15892/g.39462  ORF Transcript_15892/g.39462 Transcript_15892/m.39462 type:complete len:84 (-) Transcript_15892:2336-2587(-)
MLATHEAQASKKHRPRELFLPLKNGEECEVKVQPIRVQEACNQQYRHRDTAFIFGTSTTTKYLQTTVRFSTGNGKEGDECTVK